MHHVINDNSDLENYFLDVLAHGDGKYYYNSTTKKYTGNHMYESEVKGVFKTVIWMSIYTFLEKAKGIGCHNARAMHVDDLKTVLSHLEEFCPELQAVSKNR